MPTQEETLTALRDAAHLNQHALGLIKAEAQANFDAIRLWPESSVKKDVLSQLGTIVGALATAEREAIDMRSTATDALQSYSPDPVPPPPPYADIPSAGAAAQWSQMDW